MEVVLVGVYGVSMLFILIFSLVQLHLTYLYKKNSKRKSQSQNFDTPYQPDQYPMVTVQLPVYNEKYVINRLIDAIAAFEYPKDKLEIQVLDDSTDESVSIIEEKVAQLKNEGYHIHHIRRADRSGYKAGALQNGLQLAMGEYIAIFDADFLPAKDFLVRTLSQFSNKNIGMVQTKWGHLNKDYSLLTRLQAFGLNGHFSIEQSGRNAAGSFINFNGTAGVWRRKCIEDADGWKSDTLTEDLDLSYRAQLKGWKFLYLEDYESAAELPVIMSAVKSQQFRWNKGGAETARKNLIQVFKGKLKLSAKIHAFFHLTNSTTFLFLFIASVISLPLLYLKYSNPHFNFIFDLGSIFIIGFLAISYFYWITVKNNYQQPVSTYLKYFPLFMIFSMGLAFHNGIAVLEGLLGFKSPFVRTPKFNIVGIGGSWKGNIYLHHKITWITLLEGALSIYFMAGIALGLFVKDYGLMLFHLMLSIGYAGVFFYSLKK